MKPLLLGIDIGTSACKTALFEETGKIFAQATNAYPTYYPKPGWAEQDPDAWWAAACKGLKEIFAEHPNAPSRIAGIAADGQSWAAIPVSASGECLCNTPIWMDVRAQGICAKLKLSGLEERMGEVSGNPLSPSYTAPKILWIKEHKPDIYGKTVKFLQSNSFIAYRLTGAFTQDLSQGYGLNFFDLRKGIYDLELCRDMGISASLLPEIFPSGSVIGRVSRQAAIDTGGLLEGTPVAAGGLDAACGTLGAGVVENGQTQEQGGQAEGMSICLEQLKTDPRLISGFHAVPGKWLLQGGTVGGGSFKWFREQFSSNSSFDELSRQAQAIPPGSDGLLFLPYMSGERSPIWDANAKGVYFGLDFSKTMAHMARATMEGVAFSLLHNLEAAETAGAQVDALRSVGGAAGSHFWTQMKSDVTGKPIEVPSSGESTALGAAMLAGVAAGLYPNFDEAVRSAVSLIRRHEPDMDIHERYMKSYEIYKDLYPSLKQAMKKSREDLQ
jgi:xylulokinase